MLLRGWNPRLLLCFTTAACALAQRQRGELRLEVRDPAGAALIAAVDLTSDINQLHRTGSTDIFGKYSAQDLPFGLYRISVSHENFQTSTQVVRLGSEVPVRLTITMGVAPVQTAVVVTESPTLIDPSRTSTVNSIGSQSIAEHLGSQPGRGLLDLINAQPGWLYEANGVLHPRGSEYAVQFVVDGVPLQENRSPAFAPNFESDDVESMRVFTAGYPAEYGRKLGGVVELSSPKDASDGLRGDAAVGGGSFGSVNGYAGLVLRTGQGPLGAVGFTVSRGSITTIDLALNPGKLEGLEGTEDAGLLSYVRARQGSDSERVISEALSWPGVDRAKGGFGAVVLRVGDREIGHLHGDAVADVPLAPNEWATVRLETEEGVQKALALLRDNYERAQAGPGRVQRQT